MPLSACRLVFLLTVVLNWVQAALASECEGLVALQVDPVENQLRDGTQVQIERRQNATLALSSSEDALSGEVFDWVDKDKTGKVSAKTLSMAIMALDAIDDTDGFMERISQYFLEADADEDGLLNRTEFGRMVLPFGEAGQRMGLLRNLRQEILQAR